MSEELKHTPRPWSVIASNETVGNSLRIFAGNRFVGIVGNSDEEPTQTESNARLIAAAPDLLEALKLAQSAVADFHSGMNTTRPSEETCERNERILGSIRAAIDKAEGRAE
jgi:hypothetical protein